MRNGDASSSIMEGSCPPAQRVKCSLRTATLDTAPRRNASQNSLTRCEVESFLSLPRVHSPVGRDHETGERRHGSIDVLFPKWGFAWVLTDLGQRKLLDASVHTVLRSDTPRACVFMNESRD
jgi:hypothetical protein